MEMMGGNSDCLTPYRYPSTATPPLSFANNASDLVGIGLSAQFI